MKHLLEKIAEAVQEKKVKVEARILTGRIDSARSPSHPTNIADDKKTSLKVYSKHRSSDELDIHHHDRRHQERRSRRHRSCRHYCFPIPPVRKRDLSENSLKVLMPVNEKYKEAADYRPNSPIRKSQRYDDDMASETQEMRKKVVA